MSKKMHVATSPLTNNIYAGSVLKDGHTWSSNKADVTNEVICAFVDHAIEFKKRTGKNIILSIGGEPVIEILVNDLREAAKLQGGE